MGKYIVGVLAILLTCIYSACYMLFLNIPCMSAISEKTIIGERTVEANLGENETNRLYSDRETALLNFIKKRMMGNEGQIYTKIKQGEACGEVLSESVGLLMEYCIEKNNRVLFDKEFDFLREKLLDDKNLIRWKAANKEVNCNAAIDDFRIVRALLDAYDIWGDKVYLDTAGFIQESIFKKQVEGEWLFEFYDWKLGKSNKTIPLCYLDLYTLGRLREFNKDWSRVADFGERIISEGKPDSEIPIYYKYYDYETKRYFLDEEYVKSKAVCLTYTLYTVMHMSEINGDTEMFTNWLKKEMGTGRLYAWYDPQTGTPANDIESTAVYALAAVYAKKTGEGELYHRLIDRMMAFRVNDKKSPDYGGFGNEDTGECYSFDNLTALWALALE
ncbi:MAG: glycoside hydrolase [Clostridia bacterium]|nr:glycoside hydrolase [Clostridia bacterium]